MVNIKKAFIRILRCFKKLLLLLYLFEFITNEINLILNIKKKVFTTFMGSGGSLHIHPGSS